MDSKALSEVYDQFALHYDSNCTVFDISAILDTFMAPLPQQGHLSGSAENLAVQGEDE